MTGRIYLVNGDDKLIPMEEAAYDSERLLQELLAKYPDLLAGEQINSTEPRTYTARAFQLHRSIRYITDQKSAHGSAWCESVSTP